MRNRLTVSAVVAILSAGLLVSISSQATSTTIGAAAQSGHVVEVRYRVRVMQRAIHPLSEITSFSSSSALNVGINHPPKK